MGFNVSLSGINAANSDLSVTANNVANVNTTGFKESRAEFADLFSATGYGLSKNAVGSGVRVSNVAQQFKQGHNEQTGRSLDMAISGEGFFTMNMNGTRVYSRAGNFQTDRSNHCRPPPRTLSAHPGWFSFFTSAQKRFPYTQLNQQM